MIPRIQAHDSLWRAIAAGCVALMVMCGAGFAGMEQQVDPEAISALVHTLEGPEASELPLIYRDEGGYIKFLGAPPRACFLAPLDTKKAAKNPETVALDFMNLHGDAFGLGTSGLEVRLNRVITQEVGAFVRLDQFYAGLPVFGAQVIVHVDAALNVLNVNANILRDTRELGRSYDALTPVLTAAMAVERALVHNAAVSGAESGLYSANGDPELVVFEPALFSLSGSACPAWKVGLKASEIHLPPMTLLIDARDGDLLLRFADQAAARWREMYDTDQKPDLLEADLVRQEGDPPVTEEEYDNADFINTAYDYFGDCYDFYMNQHGRDSYDNQGSIIRAYVNYPVLNAFWVNELHIMIIGDLFLSDDVVAHEFTHGVTAVDSGLIYYSYAGAITEMYSDLGGEFVDLTNGRGNDSDEVRWWIGEDMEFKMPDTRGIEEDEDEKESKQSKDEVPGIRYMKDPTVLGEPDRLGSPFLWDPYSYRDLGGVHINCGIGNKLIYLLTDGDSFNGHVVQGMGISKVADLFYAARPMLSPTADYYELYNALRAASVMLNFSGAERANIIAGARAVEIEPPDAPDAVFQGVHDFRALPTFDAAGNPVVGLKWKNPNVPSGVVVPIQMTLYRSVTDFPTGAADGLMLPMESGDEAYLDPTVRPGAVYYYTLIVQIGTLYEQKVYAKARAGNSGMNVYTEVFGPDLYAGDSPFDLSFTQFTFRPVLPPPPGDDYPYLESMDFSDYEVTRSDGVYELPVPRDAAGGAYDLTGTDDGIIPLAFEDRVFRFFGKPYSELYLSSNGYVLFVDAATLAMSAEALAARDTSTLAAHFALPRIALLFTDLAPHIGGAMWAKELDDRIVITFENVALKPKGPVANPNRVTAQLELFDSGHIRITYLDAAITSGIVGLSDGRGVPEEPSTVYGNIRDGFYWVDFSGLGNAPSRMSLNPVDVQIVQAGETIAFDVTAELPPAVTALPVLFASWDGPGPAPFADDGDGSGRFYWETAYEDAGAYTVRLIAESGGNRVFQDVRLVVGRDLTVPPSARNVRLSTNRVGEDPTVDRTVSVGTPLMAYYEYYHPYAAQVPLLYGPGASTLYWFCNGQVVSAFTNTLLVPANVVKADDSWYFMVKPYSIGGLAGEPVSSPIITVLGVPEVTEVFPNRGLTIGGDRITIRGRRLSDVTAVTFDGVPGTGIQNAGNAELSVVTPIHAAGTVTVAVETPGGIGRMVDAFTFVADSEDPEEDIKARAVFGCGPRDPGAGSLWYDLLPAAVALLLLAVSRAFRKRPVQ